MTNVEFDDLLKKSGELVIYKMMEKDLNSLNESYDVKFSKKHEKQMKKIFKIYRKKLKIQKMLKNHKKMEI